jgi:enoyl-CoA hydratase
MSGPPCSRAERSVDPAAFGSQRIATGPANRSAKRLGRRRIRRRRGAAHREQRAGLAVRSRIHPRGACALSSQFVLRERAAMPYEHIVTETRDRVALVTLNRPKQLNALSDPLAAELAQALKGYDEDPAISVIVITGSEKAFAAGADIGAMAEWDYQKVYLDDYITKNFEQVRHTRKPVIAAVAGYALGGGCELAMMCDMIIAADTAKFGQPEITIGTIPGMGGTQRLPRAVGKAKAMDLCLTGRTIDAAEAERSGLVARVVPADKLLDETMAIASRIASFSLPVVLKVKEAVNRAYESPLADGLLFERREFHTTFGLDDQKEGMRAFVEKRKPSFRNR